MIFLHPFRLLTMRMHGVVNRAHAVGADAGSGNAGGFILGMTLGVVWTSCAGPVLGSILTVVATSNDLGWSGLLLAYAVGSGVPMLHGLAVLSDRPEAARLALFMLSDRGQAILV